MSNRLFFLPKPALAPFVRYIIGYQMYSPEEVLTTMPANPFSGLTFSFKTPMRGSFYYSHAPEAGVRDLDQCVLVGQSNTYSQSSVIGEVNVVVVAFTGTGLYHLLGESITSMTNNVIKFNQVHNHFDKVQDLLWKVDTIEKAVELIQGALLEWYYRKLSLPSLIMNDITVVTRHIEKNKGQLPINLIADKFRITTRWMEKLFMQQVGLTPKAYSRVIRFNAAVKHLHHAPFPDVFEAIEKFGYTDQSHFIKEFQYFLGTTPGLYFQYDLSFNRISQNEV